MQKWGGFMDWIGTVIWGLVILLTVLCVIQWWMNIRSR